MNLYLLRHGLAVEPGTPGYTKDAERPLTPKGKRKLWKLAAGMQRMELDFDLILSSPCLRARQTAEIIAEAFNLRKKLELSDTLTPSGSARKLIDYLSQLDPRPQEILLVGHEPCLSQLIALLVAGQDALPLALKKGGLCKLSADSLGSGRCATLEWLLTPKQMALMSGG
jgi:phosphohistidine phosphatase